MIWGCLITINLIKHSSAFMVKASISMLTMTVDIYPVVAETFNSKSISRLISVWKYGGPTNIVIHRSELLAFILSFGNGERFIHNSLSSCLDPCKALSTCLKGYLAIVQNSLNEQKLDNQNKCFGCIHFIVLLAPQL